MDIHGRIIITSHMMEPDTVTVDTPLHVAVRDGRIEDVKQQLLQNNARDVNAKDREGRTPLHLAVETCRPTIVELLLKHGAKIYVKGKNGTSPFQMAARKGFTDIVMTMVRFVESAERCESKDNEQYVGGICWFPKPSRAIHTRQILKRQNRYLLQKSDNTVLLSKKILTSGDIALQQFSLGLEHKFLGATPVTQQHEMKPGDVQYDIVPDDEDELIPIRVTVRFKDEPPNMLRRECFEALIEAIKSSRPTSVEVIEALLNTTIIDGHEMTSIGLSRDLERTQDGYTALHVALNNLGTSSKVVGILLNSGKFNVNALSPKSETPLFFAINHKHKHCSSMEASNRRKEEDKNRVLLLLKHKADVKMRNWKGETALMKAAEYDSDHIVQLFIDRANKTGIDLNARNYLGETALLKAVRARNPQ